MSPNFERASINCLFFRSFQLCGSSRRRRLYISKLKPVSQSRYFEYSRQALQFLIGKFSMFTRENNGQYSDFARVTLV